MFSCEGAITRVLELNPPLRVQNLRIFGKFCGGFYSLQNLKKKSPALRVEGFILYKFPKFSPRFARRGFIFYKICCQNLPIFGHFLDRFPLNNSQNPLKFFARFARRVLGVPKNFPALRAGGFILYKISKKFLPRFARGVLFFTKSWNFFTGGFHVGGF